MTDEVSYAYAVVRTGPGLTSALEGVEGVAGAAVRLVVDDRSPGSPAATVSSVPAEDFRESALRRRLEDLDWLESVARAHHTVIEVLSRHTTVLPLRLATVYLDDRRVEAMLRQEADDLSAALARLAGHLEWGVKIYVEPQRDAEGDGAPTAAGTADGLSPGRAYLRARRAQRHSREELYRAARQAAERVEAIGAVMAAGHARHRAQQGQLAVGTGENVVNDAYLLPNGTAAEFRARVLEAVEGLPGVRIDVTGPWAPYSFAATSAAPAGPRSPATDPTS
ncbi:GvpL/GvpF family gas vesicle protein [Streptomyces sp. NPDC048002]|uniref:GvpL/GvpF family gas vesicle protein n=1 Tax=Streptomyces sp. NPDC048002 TaxID=3154344 RepID=UPI0033BFF717